MKYILKEYHRNITDKDLIDDVRKVAELIKKDTVSVLEYENYGKYNVSTPSGRFGTWNEALKKAGLKIKKIRRVTHEELLANLKRVWDTLGRQPRWIEMVKPLSQYRGGSYANYFGTWFNALRAFVNCVNGGKLEPLKMPKKGVLKISNIKKLKRKITNGMRYDVLCRDNFKCKLCGLTPIDDPTVKLNADHIIPISKGGDTVMTNLQTLCDRCNSGKAAKYVKRKTVNVKRKKSLPPPDFRRKRGVKNRIKKQRVINKRKRISKRK